MSRSAGHGTLLSLRLPSILFFLYVYLDLFGLSSLWGQSQGSPAAATETFTTSVRHHLRQGGSDAARTMDMLSRLAHQARASGEPLTLVRGFANDLADLVIQGPPSLRGLAARTLAQIEPPVRVAVPALAALLRSEDAELRRAAADSFALLLQNEIDAVEPIFRPGSRTNLILAVSMILPAIRNGLEDVRPDIRRRCLQTVGLACVALTRLMEEPIGDDSAVRRPLQAEYEELRPLLSALQAQGSELERFLHYDDPETRILTHRVLEQLGIARDRWLRRCAMRQEKTDEKVLDQLLHQAVPRLAEELTHPDVRVRRSALDVLETAGPLALPALPALRRALRDPDRFVRWSAVRTVGKLGPAAAPQACADLTRLLHDPDIELQQAAANALKRLQIPPPH